jgi:cytochrome c oxidase cbb3-type subunit 3
MPTKVEKDAVSGTETTGHEWDGIKELNTPLPSWWLYTFYVTVAFGVVWSILYPSFPTGPNSYFGGLIGYSQRGELSASMAEAAAAKAPMVDRIAAAELEQIRADADLRNFAMAGGRAAFGDNCAPCHGAGAAGSKGFPNLVDDSWLWGGSLSAIHQTIAYGVRNTNEQSRASAMPRFGLDGLLTRAQIDDVAEHVLAITNRATNAAAAGRGAALYVENCASCHGAMGEGNQDVGAPRLDGRNWLFGGDKASVVQTINTGRNGAMPAWAERLDPATVKMLTVYVHGLGGGQ